MLNIFEIISLINVIHKPNILHRVYLSLIVPDKYYVFIQTMRIPIMYK